MKDFPIVAKLILNTILFVIYWVLFSLVLWFLFGVWGKVFWYEIPLNSDPIYTKIWIILLLLVFVLTIVFRKYFYVEFWGHEEKINKEEEKKWNNFENTF
jgi:hypothetical protein